MVGNIVAQGVFNMYLKYNHVNMAMVGLAGGAETRPQAEVDVVKYG